MHILQKKIWKVILHIYSLYAMVNVLFLKIKEVEELSSNNNKGR